jgi:hypothetical protein
LLRIFIINRAGGKLKELLSITWKLTWLNDPVNLIISKNLVHPILIS